MSKIEKDIERLKSKPKNYTYDEAKSLLNKLGFVEYNKGKTSGSRVRFMNEKNVKIDIHKPHPNNVLKAYQINILLDILESEGIINE